MLFANMSHPKNTTTGCRRRSQQQQQAMHLCSRGKLTGRPLLELIADAILHSTDKRLLVNDIYRYIETHCELRQPAVSLVSTPVHSSNRVPDDELTSTDRDTWPPANDNVLLRREATRARMAIKRVAKEESWKVHVRHILSVRKTIFPLTNEKDGRRRGRFHTINETKFAEYLSSRVGRRPLTSSGGRRPRLHHGRAMINSVVNDDGVIIDDLRPQYREFYGPGDTGHCSYYSPDVRWVQQFLLWTINACCRLQVLYTITLIHK